MSHKLTQNSTYLTHPATRYAIPTNDSIRRTEYCERLTFYAIHAYNSRFLFIVEGAWNSRPLVRVLHKEIMQAIMSVDTVGEAS